MITPACNAGSAEVALGGAARDRMHSMCPGGLVDRDGRVYACECACHRGLDRTHRMSEYERARLPRGVPSRGVGRGATEKAEERPDVASKSTYRRGPGKCECGCGADVARRFLPGHDAKLKSRLLRESDSTDSAVRVGAMVELKARGWR